MEKLKILQVCSAVGMGGGERHVAGLARALAARGHEVHLAARPQSSLRNALVDSPIEIHDVPLRNAADLSSVRALARIMKERRIGIIHAHVARDYPVAGLAARLSPARFFITRHHYNPLKSSRPYAWAIGRAHRLIAVSECVRRTLADAFPSFAERIVVIPNWVDLETVGRLSRGESRDRLEIRRRLAIAVIGQLTPLKRQDLFIRAAALLARQSASSEVEYLIIGAAAPGDEGYEKDLRDLSRDEGLGDRLRFVGFIERLPELLRAIDVVAVPSDNEAFSLALAESMAAGCAVIAARAGALAEIVTPEIDGLLSAPGDPFDLAAGLRRLIDDAALRTRLAAAAEQSVAARFEREAVIDRILNLYRE
jgi:glycosyltransferase involved in cell wall biosynthesis